MKVYFNNGWFSPRGTRYRKERSYTIPDEWKDKLPSSAEILEDDEPADAIEPELLEPPKPKRKPRVKKPSAAAAKVDI